MFWTRVSTTNNAQRKSTLALCKYIDEHLSKMVTPLRTFFSYVPRIFPRSYVGFSCMVTRRGQESSPPIRESSWSDVTTRGSRQDLMKEKEKKELIFITVSRLSCLATGESRAFSERGSATEAWIDIAFHAAAIHLLNCTFGHWVVRRKVSLTTRCKALDSIIDGCGLPVGILKRGAYLLIDDVNKE